MSGLDPALREALGVERMRDAAAGRLARATRAVELMDGGGASAVEVPGGLADGCPAHVRVLAAWLVGQPAERRAEALSEAPPELRGMLAERLIQVAFGLGAPE